MSFAWLSPDSQLKSPAAKMMDFDNILDIATQNQGGGSVSKPVS